MNRVICVVTAETDWKPMWVVQRADGSVFRRSEDGYWAYFATMAEVVKWLRKREISPVELPAGVLYGQERIS